MRRRPFYQRARARQVAYRTTVLGAGWAEHEHLLDDAAKDAGRNFVIPEAHVAATERLARGKGVDPERTFRNMLSSQAMAFNVFTPLARDPDLATEILAPLLPGVAAVRAIEFEYTPSNEIFGDQSGKGGVDCDLLIDAEWSDGATAVITIETKFVERKFSICGYRKPGRAANGLPVCPRDVVLDENRGACLYSSRRTPFIYWKRTNELGTLSPTAIPTTGCPFAGAEWQLWVNHTLAHAEAAARGAPHAMFVVCAPAANDALLADGILDRFRARLARSESLKFLALEDLLERITAVASERPALHDWVGGIVARYGSI